MVSATYTPSTVMTNDVRLRSVPAVTVIMPPFTVTARRHLRGVTALSDSSKLLTLVAVTVVGHPSALSSQPA